LATGIWPEEKQWFSLKAQNVNARINAIRVNDTYRQFMESAFQMHGETPRHENHVLIVQVKWGLGLGELGPVTEYEVLEVNTRSKESTRMSFRMHSHHRN
jgi:hypothetical protein